MQQRLRRRLQLRVPASREQRVLKLDSPSSRAERAVLGLLGDRKGVCLHDVLIEVSVQSQRPSSKHGRSDGITRVQPESRELSDRVSCTSQLASLLHPARALLR
jgi:hypothetical protein